jgi:hypothetical protein
MSKTFHITGPDHWASYLVNGDASSLTPEEKSQADAWTRRNMAVILSTTADEPRFTHHMQFYCPEIDASAGNVVTYIATNA